jgi:hypothetical protein
VNFKVAIYVQIPSIDSCYPSICREQQGNGNASEL